MSSATVIVVLQDSVVVRRDSVRHPGDVQVNDHRAAAKILSTDVPFSVGVCFASHSRNLDLFTTWTPPGSSFTTSECALTTTITALTSIAKSHAEPKILPTRWASYRLLRM
jgi:hypothetical protein